MIDSTVVLDLILKFHEADVCIFYFKCWRSCLFVLSAHTEESAMALAKTLRDAFPSSRLAFVVAMASDKDQLSFARALLTGNFSYES